MMRKSRPCPGQPRSVGTPWCHPTKKLPPAPHDRLRPGEPPWTGLGLPCASPCTLAQPPGDGWSLRPRAERPRSWGCRGEGTWGAGRAVQGLWLSITLLAFPSFSSSPSSPPFQLTAAGLENSLPSPPSINFTFKSSNYVPQIVLIRRRKWRVTLCGLQISGGSWHLLAAPGALITGLAN